MGLPPTSNRALPGALKIGVSASKTGTPPYERERQSFMVFSLSATYLNSLSNFNGALSSMVSVVPLFVVPVVLFVPVSVVPVVHVYVVPVSVVPGSAVPFV